MKNKVIVIITIFLMIFTLYIVLGRFEIGNIQILGVKALMEKKAEANEQIEKVNDLNDLTYSVVLGSFNQSLENYNKAKEEYDNIVKSSEENTNQIKKYELEYVWATLGNYAKSRNVVIKLDVSIGNSITKTYNINFTVKGNYANIKDYINDLEKDKELPLKPENFKLISENDDKNNLTATFVCKNININIDSKNITKESTEKTEEKLEGDDVNKDEEAS